MIHEDLADPGPVNTEPIEEEAIILDEEYSEYTDSYDQYISALVMIPKYDGFARALVTIRKQDSNGNIIGSCHSNPLLDNLVYEVQFNDRVISKYAANLIYENLYSHTYPDGNNFLLLNDRLDHISTDKAVKPEYDFEGELAKRKYNNTTSGWELLVEWANNTRPQSWISLKDLKALYPIQVVEYAKANGILGQPALDGGFLILSGSASI